MAEGTAEGQSQQQSPDQEPKEEEIEKAVRSLSESARYLRTLTYPTSTEDKDVARIRYKSDDQSQTVLMWKNYFDHPGYIPNLPIEIKQYENVVPLWTEFKHPSLDGTWKGDRNKVWFVLDKKDPKVIQLVDENGRPSYPDNEKWAEGVMLTGKEKWKERPDLLHDIVATVNANKHIDREYKE